MKNTFFLLLSLAVILASARAETYNISYVAGRVSPFELASGQYDEDASHYSLYFLKSNITTDRNTLPEMVATMSFDEFIETYKTPILTGSAFLEDLEDHYFISCGNGWTAYEITFDDEEERLLGISVYKNDTMAQFQTLSPELAHVSDVEGVVAYTTGVGTSYCAFKMTPEPTTYTLNLLALAGLVTRRRRK